MAESAKGLAEQIQKAEDELKAAKEEQRAANEKVKQKREELLKLQNKEGIVPLVYEVDIKRLRTLCEERTPIYGYKDLFDQVLKIRRNDGENRKKDMEDKEIYKPSQISIRIKKQGMREIEEYCIIDKSSQRVFYIKSMKNLEIKSNEKVNLKELNREIEIAKKLKELRELKEGL